MKVPGAAQRVTKDLTLLEAINAAGGSQTNELAMVIRRAKQTVVNLSKVGLNHTLDVPLRGWDVVMVVRDTRTLPPSVAVVGDVKSPQLVPFAPKITAQTALMMAGGWSQYGGPQVIFVVRDLKVMRFDLRELQRDPSKDPELQPWDIVWHPGGGELRSDGFPE